MPLRQCSSAHCSGADAEINEICKLEGWAINHPVLTRDAQGPCYCSCSCLAFGTMVQEGDGSFKAIETYVEGDEVLAAGTELEWTAQPVVFSGGTTGISRQKFTVLILYANTAIAVTSDHLFLIAGEPRQLKRADRLTTDDALLSPEGEAVAIRSVHIGDYLAGFHHISARDKEPPDESLEGHLLNTNGVVSADYTVQILARRNDAAAFSAEAHAELPIVGSPEYVERYGRGVLQAPELPAGLAAEGAEGEIALNILAFDAPDLGQPSHTFIPAEAIALSIPEGACS